MSAESYASPELLQGQMEPIHAAASNLLLLSLLPAIQVAWADGRIQDEERRAVLALAEESGLTADAHAMERITRWLEVPPTHEETEEAIAELRLLGPSAAEGGVDRVVTWARAVARAEGGLLGIGAISTDEKRALERIESALTSGGPKGSALGALEVMKDLIADRLAADTVHVDLAPRGVRTPWPRPSPWGWRRFAPAVLAIPEKEYREYMTVIIGRYVRSLKEGWWDAVRIAVGHAGVAPMDDDRLGDLMWGAPFSRFLCPTLDPVDRERFGSAVADAERLGTVYKLDQSHFTGLRPLPGIYLAGTVCLFARTADRLVPVAIAVDGRVFRPGDGESWARARYFLIESVSVTLTIGIHPHLHFPMDSVIGVTRLLLPPDHPVARVVEAHAWLQLPLDYGVQFNVRSVVHNHQNEIYTPLPARRDDIFHGIVGPYHAGIPGNSAYPGFRYPMSAPSFPGPYCEFLRRYYEVVLAFCRRVVATIPPDDKAFVRWGTGLHGLLPGFPSPDDMPDPEVRARALCGFVHTVAIWHSTEHYTYGNLPVNLVPQRLRVPPPTGDDAPVPTEQWVRPVDLARQEMSRRLFYQAHTVRAFLDVDYGFTDPGMQQAVREFRDALRACDRDQPINFLPLDQIACSLQF